jgi:hypothetical protein
LVEVYKSEQTMFLKSENPTFGNVNWVSSTSLVLIDETGKEWDFNFLTHKLTQNPRSKG